VHAGSILVVKPNHHFYAAGLPVISGFFLGGQHKIHAYYGSSSVKKFPHRLTRENSTASAGSVEDKIR